MPHIEWPQQQTLISDDFRDYKVQDDTRRFSDAGLFTCPAIHFSLGPPW